VRLSPTAVYVTILPQTVFAASHGATPCDLLGEKKRSVSALRQFQPTRKKRIEYPILFSDSRRCASLVFWAILVELKVSDMEMSYRFKHLKGARDCFTRISFFAPRRGISPHSSFDRMLGNDAWFS
jgi:hypothetical protein